MTWIDISVYISNSLVHWPGDPSVDLERVNDMEKGDPNNISKISMGSHTGTHVDAPRHFFKSGAPLADMDPGKMVGIARIIQIVHPKYITPEELLEHDIRKGERLLLKTRNSSSSWATKEFDEDFVSISSGAADFLAEKAPKLMGVDYLSVGGFKDDGAYIHRTLLGSGIWLIEGLDLSNVEPGKYYLICLPIKLISGDGAPARAIVRTTRKKPKYVNQQRTGMKKR